MGRAVEAVSDLQELTRRAKRVRATCIQMAHDGREGHLNGSLSCVDVLVALYAGWLRVDPRQPRRRDRDRFLFSKGHAVSALYAVLAERGLIPRVWLAGYATNESPLAPHPCIHALPLLECSSGSLGHGLGVGAGMSYGLRLDGVEARVVVLLSDGESNEGSVWEAATFAAANRLHRLLAIVDHNGVQSVGRTAPLTGYTSLEEKFRAFGWAARTIDGHDFEEIQTALAAVPFAQDRPSAIIAKTIAGAGVSFMQDQVVWHYRVPSDEDLRRASAELGQLAIHKE